MESAKVLQQEIVDDLRNHRIKLPNIPDVMYRIRDALMEEGKSFEEIGKIVQLDQSLTTRLIQVSNSPLFRGVSKVNTAQAAISWLGLSVVRNLATSLALKNAYTGNEPRVKRLLSEVWAESCRVSAISQVLGSVTVGIKPDKALLAGMIHNIGVLPFVNYLERYPELLNNGTQLHHVMGKLQGKLGAVLLRHWQFDEAFYDVPLAVEDLQYESGDSKPGYADIVLVAKVHSRFGRKGGEKAVASLPMMPAFQKLPIRHLGPSGSMEVLEKSKGEIETLMNVLRG